MSTNLDSAKNTARRLIRAGTLSRARAEECLRSYLKEVKERETSPDGGHDFLSFLVREEVLDQEAAAALEQPAEPDVHEVPGYKIEEAIGAGSMGTVYRAVQLSMDRPVAIKFLPAELARNKSLARKFIQEARTVARLNHLNIVTGIDVGESDGSYFFVMEFVDGETVGDLLRNGTSIEERRAIDIVRQIASALEHARENGLVHRDVKPDNILLTRDGIPKLGDLGLALEHGKQTEQRIAGTPQYISPEAVRREPVDTRSDIYGLGVTLYHMLVGQPPFEGTAREVLEKHLTEGIPDVRDLKPSVSPRASHLVTGMTGIDPAERFQTPREVAEAATIYLEQPGRALPRPKGMSSPQLGRSIAVRHGSRSRGALVAVVAAVIAGGGLMLFLEGNKGDVPHVPSPIATRPPIDDPDSIPKPPTPNPANPGHTASSDAEAAAARAFEEARIYAEENPRDFEGARRRLSAVGERYPGTEQADLAQRAADEMIARFEREAADDLAARRERSTAAFASGDLAAAREAWKERPDWLEGTPSESAYDEERMRFESSFRQHASDALQRAVELAGSEELEAENTAMTRLSELEELSTGPLRERVRSARDDITSRIAARVLAEERERTERLQQLTADVTAVRVRSDERLAQLDAPGAAALWRELAARPELEQAAAKVLKAEIEVELAHVDRLAAIVLRALVDLRGMTGGKIDYADGKASLVEEGGALLARVSGEEPRALELVALEPALLERLLTLELPEKNDEATLDVTQLLSLAALRANALELAAHSLALIDLALARLDDVAPTAATGARAATLSMELASARVVALEGRAAVMHTQARGLIEKSRWKPAVKALEEMTSVCAGSRYLLVHQLEIEDELALARNNGTAPPLIARMLHGKVKVQKTPPGAPVAIEVEYDFSDATQLEDFETIPFSLPTGGGGGGGNGGGNQPPPSDTDWQISEEKLEGSGRMQLAWKPVVLGDLVIQYEFSSPRHSNLGMNLYLNREKRESYLMCLGFDLLGSGRIASSLGSSRNLLLKVDPSAMADAEGPPMAAFIQAVKSQSSKPEVPPNRRMFAQVQSTKNGILFVFNKRDKFETKDKDFRRGSITLFAIGNEIVIDDLELSVRLDPRWLADAEAIYRKQREEAHRAAIEAADRAAAEGDVKDGKAVDERENPLDPGLEDR